MVHPRMRGVHSYQRSIPWSREGSSPHARGPPDPGQKKREMDEVHPRMRGVHTDTVDAKMLKQGSSPHARGPLIPAKGNRNIGRFIPACAGSTHNNLSPNVAA